MQKSENMGRPACAKHLFCNKDQPDTSTITMVKSPCNPFEKIEGSKAMYCKFKVLCETAPQTTKLLAPWIKRGKCISQQKNANYYWRKKYKYLKHLRDLV